MTGMVDSRSRARPVPTSALVVPVAAVVHIGVVTTAFLYTGDPLEEPTSGLGTGGTDFALFVNVFGLMVPGLILGAWAALSAGWRRGVRVLGARLGTVLTGAGFLVAGVFPMPSPLHIAGALAAELAGALVLALLGVEVLPVRRILAVAGFLLAALLVFDATTWALSTFVVPYAIHPGMGLQQRIATFGALAWMSVLVSPEGRGRRSAQR